MFIRECMYTDLVKSSILVRQPFCINYKLLFIPFVQSFCGMFLKYCPLLFITCFEIILSVRAGKNLLGPQLLYVQFAVLDICMLSNILILIYVLFKKEYVNFKLVSLNVRGVRSSTKRKALFTWLNERKYDISSFKKPTALSMWNIFGKRNGKVSSNHSCGVMVLVRSDLDFNLISINSDDVGRSTV